MLPPDPRPILDLIEAFRRSKTMFTALSLGVFDLLEQNPATPQELADHTRTDRDSLERLLEACGSLGLVTRSEDTFRNTPLASAYLARSSPNSLAGYIKYSDDVLYAMWNHLEDAVREGTHRWKQTWGLTSGALFDRFFHTDEAMRTFLMGMHGFGMLSSPAVVRAFDLTRFRSLADLGGATGHLVAAACEAYPEMQGVLFDLPRVVAFARERIAESSAQGRIACVPGDFFQDTLPPADLYALGRILHDWDQEKIHRLLSRIHAALPEGGALLIAEKLMDENRMGPTHVQMQSLNMLVCTEGRERTLSGYRTLLERAGFHTVEGANTGQPVDAILARK